MTGGTAIVFSKVYEFIYSHRVGFVGNGLEEMDVLLNLSWGSVLRYTICQTGITFLGNLDSFINFRNKRDLCALCPVLFHLSQIQYILF
jgi:hypothetical protein